MERDKIADEWQQKTFDEGVRRFNAQMAKSSGGGNDSDAGTASYRVVYNTMTRLYREQGPVAANLYLEEAKDYLHKEDYDELKRIMEGIISSSNIGPEGY